MRPYLSSAATLLPRETASKSISASAANSPEPAPADAGTKFAARPRIGDIPIDKDVSEVIHPPPNGAKARNGNGYGGPDYAAAFRDYQIAARLWRNGQS